MSEDHELQASPASPTSARSFLSACIAGAAVGLGLLALEALVLRFLGGPERPAGDLLAALPAMLVGGLLLGALGLILGKRAGTNDCARVGVPFFLLGSVLLGVHLRDHWLLPRDGMLASKSLMILGAAGLTGLLLALLASRFSKPTARDRSLLLLALCGGLVAGTWFYLKAQEPAGADPSAGPNVVLLVLDTTRVDRLSTFGYERETTPNLTAFADQGARFSRCYAAAPWTVPSHASMFTGRQTSSHHATRRSPILDGRLPTLAERMGAEGLHTVSFSKKSWLSRETGLMRGFDEMYDLHNPPRKHVALRLLEELNPPERVLDKGATETVRVAGEWIAEHGHDGRFFAFFNFNEAHSDLRPPRRYRDQFLAEDLKTTEWGRSRFPENHAFSVGDLEYEPEELAIFSDLYDAEIAYQDARFGELIESFEEHGLLENTIFLVTADHGENLGEGGLLGHEMSLNNTLLHVPLVVRYPRLVAPGVECEIPVENRLVGNLIRGLFDASVGTADETLSGEQLAQLLNDDQQDGIVSEEYAPSFNSKKWNFETDERFNVERKSLLAGQMKLQFVSIQEQPSLYDLTSDPVELSDLASSQPDLLKELFDRLLGRAELWQEVGGSEAVFSEEMRALLEGTGYF